MPDARRAWPWLVGGLALLLANLWLTLPDVNQWDESWTLQVARRVAEGDALYDDVWFNTTPLSVYTVWAFVEVVGAQILVVKALGALLAAGSGLLVARIALQAGVSGLAAAVCAALTIPLAPVVPESFYTQFAMLFFLACESVAVTVAARPGLAQAAVAGGWPGLPSRRSRTSAAWRSLRWSRRCCSSSRLESDCVACSPHSGPSQRSPSSRSV